MSSKEPVRNNPLIVNALVPNHVLLFFLSHLLLLCDKKISLVSGLDASSLPLQKTLQRLKGNSETRMMASHLFSICHGERQSALDD